MPLKDVKADGNVEFLPGRSRYNIVNTTATWCYHHMATGSTLSGEAPETLETDAAHTDPTVVASTAEYKELTKGGLFTIQAKAKRPLVVDAFINQAGATLSIVGVSHNHVRDVPGTLPFKLTSGEVFKATGGSSGGYVGLLYRIDGEEIW